MKPTIRERLVKSLVDKGYLRVPNARTTKYLVFSNPEVSKKNFYYVGRNGALRVGPNIRESVPANKIREVLLGAA